MDRQKVKSDDDCRKEQPDIVAIGRDKGMRPLIAAHRGNMFLWMMSGRKRCH